MRRWPKWLITAAALGATCSPQVITGLSPQNQASQNIAKFSVTGTVVNSVTGEPIRRALVRAADSGAMTDAEGRFELSNVPAGSIRLIARKPGYFNDEELRRYNSVEMFQIGAQTGPISLKLTPAAVLTGSITGSAGQPLEGIPIRATYVRIADGRRQFEERGGTTTDEDGNFRLAGLLPGSYYLATGASPAFDNLPPAIARAAGHARGYPGTYFPNAPTREQATAIHVAPGEQKRADFELHPVPLFNVKGRVSGIPAGGSAGMEVLNDAGEPLGAEPRFDPASGTFDVRYLPAGSYRLQANGQDGNNHALYGEIPINLQRDLEGVQVPLEPLLTIPIEVHEVSTSEKKSVTILTLPGNEQRRIELLPRISLRSLDARQHAEYESEIEPTLSSVKWLFRNVQPGKYAVHADAGEQWYVDSVSCGGIDLLKGPLTVTAALRDPIEIAVRNDAASLTAELHSNVPQTVTVLVLPQNGNAEIRAFPNVGVQGQLMARGFAPGDYSLLALSNADDFEYRSEDAIRPYLSKAVHATLYPNQQTKVELEVVSATQ